METRRDFLVGLFVLVALGIVTGTLIVTSGLGDVRYDLYVRTESAQDLTRDTRVFLQGLEIGRIEQLNPVRNGPAGTLSFVGKLAINEKFPDGSLLKLPKGSKALIAQTSPIAAPVVQIVTPKDVRLPTPKDARRPAYLQAGDTIESERRTNTMDDLSGIATKLSTEVEDLLGDTRRMLAGTSRVVVRSDSLLATTTPLIKQVLTDLTATLERTNRTLAVLEPRVPTLSDSITATLSETRQLLRRLNEVAANANAMTLENRGSIKETLDHLHRSSILMDHFIDQVSRRPVRMLTGIKMLKADSDGVSP